MSESEITLKHLFPSVGRDSAKSVMAAVASNPLIGQLEKQVLKQVQGIQWGWVLEEVWHKVPELLDVKLVNVISGGWNKARELAKYTDQKKYPPDQVILVQLAEHTVTSEHHPYVQVLVNDQPVGEKIVFDLSIVLTLKSVVLKIQDARIKAVKTGSCQAKGKIEFMKAVLTEGTLGPFQLPGAIDLGEGVSLRT